MSTATAQAFANIAFIKFTLENSIELTVRVILDEKTLADGFLPGVSPVFSKALSVRSSKSRFRVHQVSNSYAPSNYRQGSLWR
jgi:hypothetical protein